MKKLKNKNKIVSIGCFSPKYNFLPFDRERSEMRRSETPRPKTPSVSENLPQRYF